MHPALMTFPGPVLSLAELCAARLDGDVVGIGEGFLPADVPDSPGIRALSLQPLLRPGMVLSGATAAWVHGAGASPPAHHHVHRASVGGATAVRAPRLVQHRSPLTPVEVQRIAGVPVTVPARTLRDLVAAARADRRQQHWIRGLLTARPELARPPLVRPEPATDGIPDPSPPGARGQVEVTRYTS